MENLKVQTKVKLSVTFPFLVLLLNGIHKPASTVMNKQINKRKENKLQDAA